MSAITASTHRLHTLPLVPLRHLVRQTDLVELAALMFDEKLGQFILNEKIQAGAYNLCFNGAAGVSAPAKNMDWKYDGSIEETVNTVLHVYKNMSDRFPGHVGTVSVDPFFLRDLETSGFEGLEKCTRLEIAVDSSMPGDQEHIDRLLESTIITDSIMFDVLGCHLDLKKVFHLDEVDIRSKAKWILGTDLLRFDSRKLHIGENEFEDTHINRFLHHWKNAESPKLEKATISKGNWNNWQNRNLFSLLNAKPFNPETRDKMWIPEGSTQGIDMSKAMDIEREDGLLASVLVEDFQLTVVIWRDRFPMKKLAEKVKMEIKLQQNKIELNSTRSRKRSSESSAASTKRFKIDEDDVCLKEISRIQNIINQKQMILASLQ